MHLTTLFMCNFTFYCFLSENLISKNIIFHYTHIECKQQTKKLCSTKRCVGWVLMPFYVRNFPFDNNNTNKPKEAHKKTFPVWCFQKFFGFYFCFVFFIVRILHIYHKTANNFQHTCFHPFYGVAKEMSKCYPQCICFMYAFRFTCIWQIRKSPRKTDKPN